MDALLIQGPIKLKGSVTVSTAKNAYLPILMGALLNPHKVTMLDIPKLADIRTTFSLLEKLGVKIQKKEKGRVVTIHADHLSTYEATYDLVKTMRASILVLGPLLGRFGEAKVSLPGGCAIGGRPIDIHLENLKKLGAEIEVKGGYISATTKGLKGEVLSLSFPSVGATENLMMAAVYATGLTVIKNAACEPEIEDLANFLIAMGADIEGAGTSEIRIKGVKKLKEATYRPIGDRIEAATYIMAGLMTQSSIKVDGFNPTHIGAVLETLKKMGANLKIGKDFVQTGPGELKAVTVITAPFPGFPTDVQAQLMALATTAKGNSVITENIFENRFMHVPELARLGAGIKLKSKSAYIEGGTPLVSAPVMCTDLRASAALVMAALVAEGETKISRIYHLDRGYDSLEEKFKNLGAHISRIKES